MLERRQLISSLVSVIPASEQIDRAFHNLVVSKSLAAYFPVKLLRLVLVEPQGPDDSLELPVLRLVASRRTLSTRQRLNVARHVAWRIPERLRATEIRSGRVGNPASGVAMRPSGSTSPGLAFHIESQSFAGSIDRDGLTNEPALAIRDAPLKSWDGVNVATGGLGLLLPALPVPV